MTSSQNIFTDSAGENFLAGQNPVETFQPSNKPEETIETNAVSISENLQRTDLNARFARLKKAMRRRSVSIF